jgi:metal-sulfur cluster biosynthetic enzyme
MGADQTVSRVTRQSLLQRLGEIVDPCSVQANRTMDIVTMGLVGELVIDGSRVTLTLVLTEPACWFSRDLMAFAEAKIRSVPGVDDVEVRLDSETIWTPDRVSRMPPYLGPIPVVVARPTPA